MAASKADLEEQIAALCGQAVWALAGGDRGRYLDLLRERRALEQKAAEKADVGPVRKNAGPLQRGGRPTILDERALQEAFDREVDMVDFPRRDGAPGWRTQADVCEWILKQLGKGEKRPAESTLKAAASRMMKRTKARLAASGKRAEN